jgi:hypothetical protein
MTAGTPHRAGMALGRALHVLVPADRVERLALAPSVTSAGYAVATGLALLWGSVLSGFQVSLRGGVIVCQGLPRWAFGRGGTTIGAVYLTDDAVSESILAHEAVHRAQWRRYGLALIPLYLAAGRDPLRNRFEIDAGLEAGGYR